MSLIAKLGITGVILGAVLSAAGIVRLKCLNHFNDWYNSQLNSRWAFIEAPSETYSDKSKHEHLTIQPSSSAEGKFMADFGMFYGGLSLAALSAVIVGIKLATPYYQQESSPPTDEQKQRQNLYEEEIRISLARTPRHKG